MAFTQSDLDSGCRAQAGVDDDLKPRNLILNDVARQSAPQQVCEVSIYTTNGGGH